MNVHAFDLQNVRLSVAGLPEPGGWRVVACDLTGHTVSDIKPGRDADDYARQLFAIYEADPNCIVALLYNSDGFVNLHELD